MYKNNMLERCTNISIRKVSKFILVSFMMFSLSISCALSSPKKATNTNISTHKQNKKVRRISAKRMSKYVQDDSYDILVKAFRQYDQKKYVKAIARFKHFINITGDEDLIAIAKSLIAICEYSQIDYVTRDDAMAMSALSSLESLLINFRQYQTCDNYTHYKCYEYVGNWYANFHISKGAYYMNQKQYVAAINRFQKAILLIKIFNSKINTFIDSGVIKANDRDIRTMNNTYLIAQGYMYKCCDHLHIDSSDVI